MIVCEWKEFDIPGRSLCFLCFSEYDINKSVVTISQDKYDELIQILQKI